MQIVEATPVPRQSARARRKAAETALELWFAIREIGLTDAVAWIAHGGGGVTIGPEELAISIAAKDWVKRNPKVNLRQDVDTVLRIADAAGRSAK